MKTEIRGLTLVSTAEAAKRLGVSRRRVQKLCQQDRLGVRVGRDYAVAIEEIEKILSKKNPR